MIELARRLNLEIMRAAGGVHSCPAFAGCYNEELGTVCYVNAGHTPGLLRDDAGWSNCTRRAAAGLFSLLDRRADLWVWERMARWRWFRAGWERSRRTRSLGGGVKGVMKAGLRRPGSFPAHLQQVQDFMHGAPKHNDVTRLRWRGEISEATLPLDWPPYC